MTYTEEYREHIEYTFHAYCKIVIYHVAIDAARQRHRRCEKEISLEYLTEEKHYPLSTLFNIGRPADFTGHSLSVSDVVVLHQDGENTSHYVDSVGYREIPEFTKELSVSSEIAVEKDAVIEIEETTEIPAEEAEEYTAAENTMAEPDNDKETAI